MCYPDVYFRIISDSSSIIFTYLILIYETGEEVKLICCTVVNLYTDKELVWYQRCSLRKEVWLVSFFFFFRSFKLLRSETRKRVKSEFSYICLNPLGVSTFFYCLWHPKDKNHDGQL